MSRFTTSMTELMSSGMFALTMVTSIAGGVAVGTIVLMMAQA
ncbi:MAG: hypothetical protein ACPGOV_04935 [Magnetovibrionaceae bacterium]